MKLYFSPGACSLAPHIVVREAGLDVALDKITFGEQRTTEGGLDFYGINPQGSVPTLELDDGSVLTENAAVLQYLAAQAPNADLAPPSGMAHWRLLETLNFIATELHKGFSPLFHKPSAETREAIVKQLLNRLALLQGKLGDKQFLVGDHFTIADAYAFVVLRWAHRFGLDLSSLPRLTAYFERLSARPAVQAALQEEGLPPS
ncbi:MAG: glutathione transferase GstA [Proteobacteria bacterium]|nr:glutathione transferase GstA [Pseudomonadota bacterium]